MAKLTELEKTSLLAPLRSQALPPPPPPKLTRRQYLDFATFASRLARVEKRVAFVGQKWRL